MGACCTGRGPAPRSCRPAKHRYTATRETNVSSSRSIQPVDAPRPATSPSARTSSTDPGPPPAEQPVLRVSGFVVRGGVEVSFKSPKKKALRRFAKAWRAARRMTSRDRASLPEGRND
jgi:hypothetical protein